MHRNLHPHGKRDKAALEAGFKCLARPRSDTAPTLPTASPRARAGSGERDRVVLLVLAGREQGSVFSISPPGALIGSDRSATVNLTDETVSRHHARLTLEQGGAYLEDLSSRNGTFVNERRAERRTRLENGDRLRFGDGPIVKFSLTDELEARTLCTLFELTLRDPLTRLYNRRYFDGRVDGELSFAKRQHTALALLLLDIDHFKQVNDTYGHPVGDEVLRKVASSIGASLRPEDTLVRYGGEEFAILARNTSFANAEILGERVRDVVQNVVFASGGRDFHVTVSVGVTAVGPTVFCASARELLLAADEALYHAKSAGRNCLSTLRPSSTTRQSTAGVDAPE